LSLPGTDPVVDFNRGGVRFFHENTVDGRRVYIDNQLVIDRWNDGAAEEFSGTTDLNAGQRYNMRMEYHESGGDAVVRLSWSCNYQSKKIVFQGRLYSESIQPTPGPGANPGDVNVEGSINIVDAFLVTQYYAGLNPSNIDVNAADTNCDGSVNITDVLLIVRY
jgi:hypothetical protein